MFDNLEKVGAGDVLLHGCPQSCVPKTIEGLLEVYEDIGRGLAGAEDISHRGFVG